MLTSSNLLWIGVLALASLAGAQQFREVVFETEDGGRIHGDLYGAGAHAVVLAHGAVFNKESWREQAKRLAGEGLEALAIDFRGYGQSRSGSRGRALYLDVLGAVRYLRDHGARRVSVVGASMGGGAAARAAIEARPGEIDRLVLLAHAPVREPEKMQGEKLFIVSEGDGLAASVREQYRRAREPKRLLVLPGSAHAQHIFKTAQGGRLLEALIEFLSAS